MNQIDKLKEKIHFIHPELDLSSYGLADLTRLYECMDKIHEKKEKVK